jgi:hypothetical protein
MPRSSDGGEEDAAPEALFCAYCGTDIDTKKEEYIRVNCSIESCRQNYHADCMTEFLLGRAAQLESWRSREKYEVSAKKRPAMLLQQHWQCPCVYAAPGIKAEQPCNGFTSSGDLVKPAKTIVLPPPAAAGGPRAAAQKKQQLPSLRPTKKPVLKQLSGSTHFTAHVPTPGSGLGGSRGLLGDSLGVGAGAGAKTFAQEQASREGAAVRSSWFYVLLCSTELHTAALTCLRQLGLVSLIDCSTVCLPLTLPDAQEEARKAAEKKRRRKGSASGAAPASAATADAGAASGGNPAERSVSTLSPTPSAEALPVPLPVHDSARRAICISSLTDMGFSWRDAEAAADASGGELETALHLLTSGAVGRQSGAGWAGDSAPGTPGLGSFTDWHAPTDASQPGSWNWANSSASLKAQASDWGHQYAAAPAAPAVVEASAEAGTETHPSWQYVPPPEDRGVADDAEVDQLMAMLGLAC